MPLSPQKKFAHQCVKVVMGDGSSPQYARALKATENAWREMAAEFGLLTEAELSAAVAEPSAGPQFALNEMAAWTVPDQLICLRALPP